jgi:formylglycine-generating enzyme
MTTAATQDITIIDGEDAVGRYQDIAICGVVQRMRWIAEGEFLMGSPEDEPGRFNDEAQRLVKIENGYWLADSACTQALYRAVTGESPSHFKGSDLPVERVSWRDAQAFVSRLNALLSGAGFRLPSEAEWEYACRAGTTTAYSFGDRVTEEQVNFDGESTVPVKSLPANAWGLHEMHGNVWEWCEDKYSDRQRVLRGGGWFACARYCRSAYRLAYEPGDRDFGIGFRLARGAC